MHSLEKGLRVLFPAIKDKQFRLADHSDGNGVVLSYLDPQLGPMPSKEQLLEAASQYIEPSKLEGGSREPTSEELASSIKGIHYIQDKVQEVINVNCHNEGFFRGADSLSRYLFLPNSKFHKKAKALTDWINSCWEMLDGLQDEVQSGSRQFPTAEEVINLLPPYNGVSE